MGFAQVAGSALMNLRTTLQNRDVSADIGVSAELTGQVAVSADRRSFLPLL